VRRPNIVFILADGPGYGDIRCLNPEHGKILTPHVDRLKRPDGSWPTSDKRRWGDAWQAAHGAQQPHNFPTKCLKAYIHTSECMLYCGSRIGASKSAHLAPSAQVPGVIGGHRLRNVCREASFLGDLTTDRRIAMRVEQWTGAAIVGLLSGWLGLMVGATAVGQTGTSTGVAPAVSGSKGLVAMESAARANKYLFIFFYNDQDTSTATMNGVFQAAMRKLTDRADALAIHLADPAEKPILDRFGVRGAPMPLVLAIAPTGAATRAFPKQFDEEKFQQAFVSPCTAKCMRAIQDRRTILLCVQNGKTQFNQAAMQGVEAFKADPQYTRGTEIVVLNPSDQAEQPFLKALQVDPQTTAAITLLVTPPGAPVARFVGAVTKAEIETKLKEVAANCGPNCSCHQR
jgi:hypothetical protein